MANPSASGYGYWDSGNKQWRSWVRITQTAITDTSATYQIEAWLCSKNGSSSNASNIGGWAGIWDTTNGYRWSGKVNVGNFGTGAEWCFKTQSWDVPRLHSAQTVYGYSDIVASDGIYSGRTSNNTGEYSVTLSLAAKTHYSVSYNANGGSGAPAAQTKWYGETLTLQSDTPTRTGYTFAGWNTKSDGTGTNYAKSGSYIANTAATLYAKWTANTYAVTFYGNGNTGGSTAAQTKTYGVSLTLRTNGFTKTGYTFKGWATSATGSVAYTNGASYTGNAALDLYAVWQVNTYSVTYDANGGSGAPATQTKTYNVTLKLSSSAPTRTGYAFKGWATTQAKANSGTVDYSAGGSYTANEAAILYATWQVSAPSLAITRVYRCTSAGVADDDGTYAAIEASWSSTVSGYSGITWQAKVGTITSFTVVAHQESGNSGTVTIVVGSPSSPLSTDDTYDVELKATDSNGTSTRTGQLSVAWYPIDIKVGGHAIAFGKVASDDYVADFGMAIRSDDSMTINNSKAGTNTFFGAQRTDTGNNIYFGIGSGGINRGIWDTTLNKWILYVDSSGNTNVSGLTTGSIPSLAADKISSGTFDAARIPSLAASKIGSGQLAVARGGTGAATASANTVFAGPSSGSAAAPSFRSLVTADLPTVSFTSLGTTSGETSININCSGYAWILVRAYYSTTYWSTIIVPTGQLDASTYRDFYLGGGWWSSGYGASFKAIKTKFTPYRGVVGSTTRDMNWAIWGIK